MRIGVGLEGVGIGKYDGVWLKFGEDCSEEFCWEKVVVEGEIWGKIGGLG